MSDTVREDAPDVLARRTCWKKIRLVLEGQDALHAAGEDYLPKPPALSANEYAGYQARATLYGATSRTQDVLSGLVFRKDPQVEAPAGMADLLADITGEGLPLLGLAQTVIEEVLATARFGILIDHPSAPEGAQTKRDAEDAGVRPYAVTYKAENILGVRTGRVGNRAKVIQVRLLESVQADGADEFTHDDAEQVRVLDLVDGKYRQRLFIKTDQGWVLSDEFGAHGEIYPKVNGQHLEEIPFVFFGPRDNSAGIDRPPLDDLANENLAHYQIGADIRHALWHVAPTIYVTGWDTEKDGDLSKLGTGGGYVITVDEPTATVGILEFTGQGLKPAHDEIDRIEARMAALGARMLAPEKKAVEAAQTLSMRHMGENASLARIVQVADLGLTRVMELMAGWAGQTGEVSVALNRDFVPANIDPTLLRELLSAVQLGRISHQSFFEAMQRGEVIDPLRTFEEEQDLIEDDPSGLPPEPGGDAGQ